MLMSFDEASKKIAAGALLHISGNGSMLRKLPRGNWVGGSTEHFMTKDGCVVSGSHLFVTEFPYADFTFKTYDKNTISNIGADAFDNGFSIVLAPAGSAIHLHFAEHAPTFKDIFTKNITGWITGTVIPIAVNGNTGDVCTDKAVVLHISLPEDKIAAIGVIDIFSVNESSPTVIEFTSSGFAAETCLVNGVERNMAEYITEIDHDTRLPLIGDYSGNGVNLSFRMIEGGITHFHIPFVRGIKYRLANPVTDYEEAFNSVVECRSSSISGAEIAFACNCFGNFIYGNMEGKSTGSFVGPITFGEIAGQLVNQTLVYVSVQ